MTGKKNDEDKDPECPDDTSTVYMEEGVIDRKIKVKKYYEVKEAECPDDTSPDEIEQNVGARNYYKNGDNDE